MQTYQNDATAATPNVAMLGTLIDNARSEPSSGAPGRNRSFRIESADSFIVRESANTLLRERYGWRGYQTVSLPANQTFDRVTLTAVEEGRTIGTITVGMDVRDGMGAADGFGAEIRALRAAGRRVCEFTKLAVDAEAGTNRVLAALFHVAYIVAHRVRGFDTLVMEVNPRHVRYYQRMLGGHVIGSERINTAVNAPAVLLCLDFSHAAAQIAELGGGRQPATKSRTLYPLFFGSDDETGIIRRLMSAQTPPSSAMN